MAQAIKRELKATGITEYPEIKPCPDTRTMGEIVQVADMFAGAVHDGGAGASWLARLRHKYTVIQEAGRG